MNCPKCTIAGRLVYFNTFSYHYCDRCKEEIILKAAQDNEFVNMGEFEISKILCTQEQWTKIMGSNPSYFKGINFPVDSVCYEDIQEYIKKLDTIYSYRLPTEQEWELACTKDMDDLLIEEKMKYGWFYENSKGTTNEIAKKLPNRYGLYDMLGNVWEWTDSLYNNGPNRVIRGGGWFNGARNCRSAFRCNFSPGFRDNDVGFRLVRTKK